MNFIPDDLIPLIFTYITKITDKRQFLRVCKRYNNLTKNIMCNFEKYNITNKFGKYNVYCVEKFTLELCYDSYFNMIPISYIISNNKILIKTLVKFNNIELLQIAINNGHNMDGICYYSAKYGNLDILKWARKNNCVWNACTCSNAAKYGHLEILKWALENQCNRVYRELFGLRHDHIIKWLITQSYVVDWLHKNKFVKEWLNNKGYIC